MENILSYKPSAFFFRHELRAARTKKEAVEVGMNVVAELELLKEWVRTQGLVPPRWHVTPFERASKHEGEVIPWQTTAAPFEMGPQPA